MSATKFSPAVAADIVARIEQGCPFKDAARAVGVKPETARGWLTKGRRQDEGAYSEFAVAVEQARAKATRAASRKMGSAEFGQHFAQAVRAGSVQAMKLWADIHLKGKDAPPTDDPFDLNLT